MDMDRELDDIFEDDAGQHEIDEDQDNELSEANVNISQGSTSTATTPSTTATGKRKKQKALTSSCWNHFTRYKIMEDGKKLWKAKCKYCKKVYNGDTSLGTSTLTRHGNTCFTKYHGKKSLDQPTLNFHGATGELGVFHFDHKVWRNSLVELIASEDLPIRFGASRAYEKHIRKSFDPSFSTVSARTIRRDIEEYYIGRVRELIVGFRTSTYCVALTSDIWDSRAHLDYCSVVAHYIDDKWTVQKRIIGFRLVDRHTGAIISSSILQVLQDYELVHRTISITFDNASANKKAIDDLEAHLTAYNDGVLLHQRCACHIINLIVQAGLGVLQPYVGKVRRLVSWIRLSNQRINALKAECVAAGMRPRIFDADMPIRWNSTYTMLKRTSEYRMPIMQYFIRWKCSH